MKKIKSATLAGMRWPIKWEREIRTKEGEPLLGQCVTHPLKDRKLRILEGLDEKETFDTLIHEMLHALFPFFEEFVVNQAASEITNAMWRAGARLGPPED